MDAVATVASTVVSLLEAILPTIGATTPVGLAIDVLEQIVPLAIADGPTVIADVQAIIADIKGGATPLTIAQIEQLQASEAQIDAAFDAANAAAGGPAPPAAS